MEKFDFTYTDDFTIFSVNKEDHLEHLRHILKLLTTTILSSLKINAHLHLSYIFRGFLVKVSRITNFPNHNLELKKVLSWPSNVSQLSSFLGTISYYHRFIKDAAVK